MSCETLSSLFVPPLVGGMEINMRIALSILLLLVCLFLIGVVIFQEGNSQGLGAVGGMAESYWGKNKGRSLEGKLQKFTAIAAALFIILSLVLNIIG